jgi:hypothetical protein
LNIEHLAFVILISALRGSTKCETKCLDEGDRSETSAASKEPHAKGPAGRVAPSADSLKDRPLPTRILSGVTTISPTNLAIGLNLLAVEVHQAGSYTLTAVAWDNAGLHTTTAPVTVTVVSVAVPPPESLAAPANLAAALAAGNHVALQWTDNSANEQGFAVDCSTNGIDFVRMTVLGPNTCAWADASVRPGQTYFYRVCALGLSSNSDFSNIASISTTAAAAPPPPFQVIQHFDRAAQRLFLTWPNTAGTVYRVVFKESLDQSAWTDLTEDIGADGPTAAWEIPVNTGAPHRFFGVKVMP